MVTVVTEGIFSAIAALRSKSTPTAIIGHERAMLSGSNGEPIGHVMTSEYGSKMLSLGGVEHLTGGTKAEGPCDM